MPVSFRERPTSRSAESSPAGQTLNYSLGGVIDDVFAKWYVTVNTPLMYDGLYRQNIRLTALGGTLWDVEVPYGPIEKKGSGEFRLSFETTGGTAHITQAKEPISRIKADLAAEAATDHGGAIGVTENGPEGTDVVVSQFKWTEAWELPIAYASFAYAMVLKAITGKVNQVAFRGFGVGQVRFDGVVGSASNKDPETCSLTFHFTQSDDTNNAVPTVVADGVAKGGWQYLWMSYERKADPVSKAMATVPLAVYVERVYDAADFGLLGIGSGV